MQQIDFDVLERMERLARDASIGIKGCAEALAALLSPSMVAELICTIRQQHAQLTRYQTQVAALQSDENSYQSGYTKGRHDGARFRLQELRQTEGLLEKERAKNKMYEILNGGKAAAEGKPNE